MATVHQNIRIYDLAKELRLDNEVVMNDARREGMDVSVPSNTVPFDVAERIRLKYFPKKEVVPRPVVRLLKRQEQAIQAGPRLIKHTVPPLRLDPRQADANYQSFPPFSKWAECLIDEDRWERYILILTEERKVPHEVLLKAFDIVKRAAAVDTGAIEGLYDVDRGFTLTVATEAALWEAAIDKKGENVRSLIESQIDAYNHVLDFATKQIPIAEAWVRGLHSMICSAQDTYSAYTEIGIQQLELPKGVYKSLPNHVVTRDGAFHSYAPVDLTGQEMHRLCEELRSESFELAHPILQASYAHYGLVAIHPFADGNGRVSRALASIYSYRALSVPLLILAENKSIYLESLTSADNGDFQPFVDFILERTLDAVLLVDESLRTASLPPIEDSLRQLKRVYLTKGGYSHTTVDDAGYRLFELFKTEMTRQLKIIKADNPLEYHLEDIGTSDPKLAKDTSRWPVANGRRELKFTLKSSPPAQAEASQTFTLEVPKDCGREDLLAIAKRNTQEIFEARITELLPVASAGLQMRLAMAVERILRESLTQLAKAAISALKRRGY